ncbi:shock factor protein [Seminavis robusta]|uniref:Shock factor protein n=1 Tax=Seminavis robusta TaxID=568900 RepID=A0A9N8HAK1_9STRA|nr:shock factor protein [Seminavis robusta]|eukprot:Sro228_g092630.1 shock factor protein (406) ;mRNA; r:32699-34234
MIGIREDFTMSSSSTNPNSSISTAVAALILQQQLQQQQQTASSSSAPSFNSATAQAILKHQEDQLRATRLLLQQRQLDEIMAAGASTSAANTSSSRSNSFLARAPASGLLGLSNAAALTAACSGGQESSLAALAAHAVRRASSTVSSASVMEAASQVAAEEDDQLDEEDQMGDEEYFKAFTLKEGKSEDGSASDSDDKAGNESFPHKLYRMLYEAEQDGHARIVSFLPSGRGFTIHKPKEFVSSIMPKYFTTRRIASFQRQLNLYGFRRISEGKEKGAYFHKDFVKGKRSRIQRIKRKSTASRPSVTAFAQRFATAPLQFPVGAPSMYGANPLLASTAPSVNKDLLLARMAAAASSQPMDSASLLEMTRQGLLASAPTHAGSHQDILRNAAASLLFKNGNNGSPF